MENVLAVTNGNRHEGICVVHIPYLTGQNTVSFRTTLRRKREEFFLKFFFLLKLINSVVMFR